MVILVHASADTLNMPTSYHQTSGCGKREAHTPVAPVVQFVTSKPSDVGT